MTKLLTSDNLITRTNEAHRTAKMGDAVQWRDRFGRTIEGVCVSVNDLFPASGCSSITVYCSHGESSRVYGLTMIGGNYTVIGTGSVDRAREDYKQYLMTFPAWCKNFENGIGVGW